MKKLDTLKERNLKPKKQTVAFIKNFSKSLEILKTKDKNFRIYKN